jgi:hypothetical protein
MKIADASGLSGFARKTAERASGLGGALRNLIMDVRDSYRPELHYMRGPGPRWRARHFQPASDREVEPLTAQHRLSPVYVRRRG